MKSTTARLGLLLTVLFLGACHGRFRCVSAQGIGDDAPANDAPSTQADAP
ncbi:MAG TPA: hypothetical protein VGM56_13520 [Byssovorax sp.]